MVVFHSKNKVLYGEVQVPRRGLLCYYTIHAAHTVDTVDCTVMGTQTTVITRLLDLLTTVVRGASLHTHYYTLTTIHSLLVSLV